MRNTQIVVVNIFLGKGLGGIEKSFADYVNYFEQLGYNSKAITTKCAKVSQLLPKTIELRELANFGEWDFIASYRLKSMLRDLRANIVIIHGRRSAKLCRFVSNIPKIGVAHNYSLKYLLSLDFVLAITADLKAKLCELGYKKEKIFDLPHMISIPKKKPQQTFSKVIIIGAMGRFVPEKGFDILLRALKKLKDTGIKFKLLLAGDGKEKENLQKIIQESSLSKEVQLVGWVDDIAKFYNKINIFCLSSRKESFGLALIEAFAHAKAVVSFKTKGPSHIGEDNKDIVFAKCEDEDDLAKKISILIKNKELIKSLGDNAYKKAVEHYDTSKKLKDLDNVINKIMNMV